MGKIKRGILGGFQGKVANVVGTSWKGIAVMKALPLSVANPRTVGQVNQRNKFQRIVEAASILLAKYVKPLNDRFAQGQSGYNLFVSRNIDNIDQNGTIGGAFELSRGKLPKFKGAAELSDTVSKRSIMSWNPVDYNGTNLPTDEVFVLAQDVTGRKVGIMETAKPLSTGLINIDFEDDLPAGSEVKLWVSIRRADGSDVSDTYFETITTS